MSCSVFTLIFNKPVLFNSCHELLNNLNYFPIQSQNAQILICSIQYHYSLPEELSTISLIKENLANLLSTKSDINACLNCVHTNLQAYYLMIN